MAELGAALNVLSLGYDVCKDLLDYYLCWKDAKSEVVTICRLVEQLRAIFGNVHDTLDEKREQFTTTQAKLLSEAIDACNAGVDELCSELSRCKFEAPKDMRLQLLGHGKRLLYPLRARTLRKMVETVQVLTSNLDKVVMTVTLNVNVNSRELLDMIASQTKSTAEAVTAFQSIADDFVTLTYSTNTQLEQLNHDARERKVHDDLALKRDILRWLSPPSPHQRHDLVRRRNEPNTGLWFLNGNVYKTWKEQDNPRASIIWLHGKPGCGKTGLVSSIIEDLRNWQLRDQRSKVLFFYFSFLDPTLQTYSGFLKSMISQLIEGMFLYEDLQAEYEAHHTHEPTDSVLEVIFGKLLNRCDPSFLVIDALDECLLQCESTRSFERDSLVKWLKTLVHSSKSQLRAVLTSRDEADITEAMQTLSVREVTFDASLVNKDISRHLDTQLENDSRLRKDDYGLREEIKVTILQKADGMFLLASCLMEQLKLLRSWRPKHIRNILNNLPPTLEATYERALSQIEPSLIDEARVALMWLAFGNRSLTLEELGEVCITDAASHELVDRGNRAPPETILGLLGSLVTVDRVPNASLRDWPDRLMRPPRRSSSADWTLRLAHASVKQFLISDKAPPSFRLNASECHWEIAQNCLAYLWKYRQTLNDGHWCDGQCECMPLVRFALLNWRIHAESYNATMRDNESRFHDRLVLTSIFGPVPVWLANLPKTLLQRCMHWDWASRAQCYRCLSLLVVKDLLRLKGINVAQELSAQQSLLHAYCIADEQEGVRLLIRSGIPLNDEHGAATAIQSAVLHERQAIIDVFTDEIKDARKRAELLGSALQAAASSGDADMVNKLILARANVNEPGTGGFGRALHAAASGGHDQIVRRLVAAGAAINHACPMHGTALDAAAYSGKMSICNFLLDNGAKLDIKAKTRWHGKRQSTLAAVFFENDQKMAELLVARGLRMAAKELDFWKAHVEWCETYGGWRTKMLRTL